MDQERIKKYAQCIVLKGANVQKDQIVDISIAADQYEFARLLVEECYKAGAKSVRVDFVDDVIYKLNVNNKSLETLTEFPLWEEEKLKYKVEHLPVRIYITSEDPDGLKGVDQEKSAKAQMINYPKMKKYIDQMENKYQWVIAGVPSKEWARKVFPGLSDDEAVEKLWEAILYTSRITEDPLKAWDEHNANLANRCNYLNNLHLKELRYKSSNGTDFKVGLIEDCLFEGGGETTLGSNIYFNPNMPTEECFTSPKKGEAEGIVYSTKPLSYNGEIIDNFWFKFEKGKVVDYGAEKNKQLLDQMLNLDEGASYLGECALVPVDSPVSNSNILFFETLYDENASCHLALGMGFTNLIKDYDKYTLDELHAKGINDSMSHVDFMIGSKDLDIVGVDQDGKEHQIFKNGDWAF